jgi:Ca-activated chloride channel family protein
VIRFDAPAVLILAPVVAAAAYAGGVWARRVRVTRAARWSSTAAARARTVGRWSPAALAVATFAGVAALAGPRWGEERVVAETRGLNLVLAVDISRSMLAEDVAPSRLDRARREARRLVQDLEGDRIGLVAFAGASYILSPLTVDAGALALFLDALDPEIASAGGTALTPALARAAELLRAGPDVADRVLVLFTDGEAHDSLPAALALARRLADAGVHVVLVAEGGTAPVGIPLRDDRGALAGWRTDGDGREIRTARRDDVLAALADAARGTLVAADLADQAGAVRDLVASFRRGALTETQAIRGRARAWIPLLVGAVVLGLQAWTRPTAALLGIALALAVAPRGGAAQARRWRPPAERAWAVGDAAAAAAAYLRERDRRPADDTVWYNAGTAALAAGDAEEARAALGRAAASLDPTVRFRALFNLGVLALRLAETDSVRADAHAADAERAYREALLLMPGDRAAKWNLELATRRRHGGAGGGAPPPAGGPDGAAPPETPRPPGERPETGLTPQQAEQLLQSIAQEELRTRRDRVGRARRAAPPGVKDW